MFIIKHFSLQVRICKMKAAWLIILLEMFLYSSSLCQNITGNLELKSLVILLRSGIESPRELLSKNSTIDQWMIEDNFPRTLLRAGKRQMYLLGRQISIDYQNFLRKINPATDFNAISRSYSAEITSTQAFTLGLFPDTKVFNKVMTKEMMPPFPGVISEITFNTTLPAFKQPLRIRNSKVNNVDQYFDLGQANVCPNVNKRTVQVAIDRLNDKFRFEQSYQLAKAALDLNEEKISSMSNKLSVYKASRIYEYLSAQNVATKNWLFPANSTVFKDMKICNEAYLVTTIADPEINSLMSTPLISSLVKKFTLYNSTLSPFEDSPIEMYMGHDKWMTAILIYLKIINPECFLKPYSEGTDLNCKEFPHPSTNLIFEIYKDTVTGAHFIRTRYNGETIRIGKEPSMAKYPDMNTPAYLIKFIQSNITENWKDMCGLGEIPNQGIVEQMSNWIIVLVIWTLSVVVIFAIGSYVIQRCYSKVARRATLYTNPMNDSLISN